MTGEGRKFFSGAFSAWSSGWQKGESKYSARETFKSICIRRIINMRLETALVNQFNKYLGKCRRVPGHMGFHQRPHCERIGT